MITLYRDRLSIKTTFCTIAEQSTRILPVFHTYGYVHEFGGVGGRADLEYERLACVFSIAHGSVEH